MFHVEHFERCDNLKHDYSPMLSPVNKGFDTTAALNNATYLDYYKRLRLLALSMFEWENLPETIPKKELEKQLQVNGYSFITKIKGKIYALNGSLGGEVDEYGNATQITINNIALDFNETLSLKDDGVLICNDDLMLGLMPVFTRYNTMIMENDINLSMLGYSSRSQILLTASDNKSKASAELFIKKLINGDLSVIGENPIFDGVKALNLNTNGSSNFNSLIEFNQYLKGSLYNEVGIQANTVMKRERVNSEEVNANNDLLFPFIYNMLENRLTAIKLINEKYSENIAVDFGSIWKVKAIEKVDNIVSRETDNEPINEPFNEPFNEPNNEPINEPINEPNNEPNNEPSNEVGQYLDKAIEKDIADAKEMLASGDGLTDDDKQELQDLITDLENEVKND